jgi:outer membrane protein assembly factor BamD (BamD/ComL family)
MSVAPQGPVPADPGTPPPPPYDPAPLYQRGLDAYGDGQWQTAADLFAEVLRWQPGHRDALRLLREARRHLYGDSPLDELYTKAERNLQRKQWNAAVKKLEEIYNTQPNYKDVAARLPEARRILKEHKRELALARLYRQADALAQTGDWAGAIRTFTRLARKQPRYQDTEQRILELSKRLAPGVAP